MPRGRPKSTLTISKSQHQQLEAWTRSPSLPQGLALRARIVLLAAQGASNREIAARVGLSHKTVGKWRRRFLEHGMAGIYDEIRPGRPRTLDDEQIARVLQKTLSTLPENSTHWSCRELASQTGLSKIQRPSHLEGLRREAPSLGDDETLDGPLLRG